MAVFLWHSACPIPAPTPPIAAGDLHSCALKHDAGTVSCWGSNTDGQLGDGTNANRSTPTTVPGLTGVTAITADHVAIRTSTGIEQRLPRNDPMLERLDLAYAMNAHMAQGLTADRGIAVMDSHERRLLSARNFLVTITRLRDIGIDHLQGYLLARPGVETLPSVAWPEAGDPIRLSA